MWCEYSNSSILNGIEAGSCHGRHQLAILHKTDGNLPFKQHDLVWGQPTDVFPFVAGVILDGKGLALPIRVDQCDREDIILWINAPKIAQSERPIERWNFYWPPQIDDLEAVFEQFWGFCGGKVPMDAGNRRPNRLINVGLLDRLTFVGAVVYQPGAVRTDS